MAALMTKGGIVKKTTAVSLLFVLLLVGCAAPAPKAWYKDGVSEDIFRRDQMGCRQYGMQSAQANGLAGNMFVETWIQREAETCLRNLGYRTM